MIVFEESKREMEKERVTERETSSTARQGGNTCFYSAFLPFFSYQRFYSFPSVRFYAQHPSCQHVFLLTSFSRFPIFFRLPRPFTGMVLIQLKNDLLSALDYVGIPLSSLFVLLSSILFLLLFLFQSRRKH